MKPTPEQHEMLRIIVDHDGGVGFLRAIDALPMVRAGWLVPSASAAIKDMWRVTREGRAAVTDGQQQIRK